LLSDWIACDDDRAMLTCEMPSGALANLWISFAASDRTSDPWTVVYKILGTNGGATGLGHHQFRQLSHRVIALRFDRLSNTPRRGHPLTMTSDRDHADRVQ
jgi:hypothetical protein